MKKRNKIIILLTVLAVVLAYYTFNHFVPQTIVATKHPIIEFLRKKRIPTQIVLRDNQQIIYLNNDKSQGVGILTTPTDSIIARVVLLHGIRGNKFFWQNQSDSLAQHGVQTLAIDLPAHGDSPGRYTSFGVNEKLTVSAWVKWLDSSNDNTPIGVWGHSLGGAVALQSIAYEPSIRFGVIESTFSEFPLIINDYSALFLRFSNKRLSNFLMNRAASIAQFEPNDASPINHVDQINQPILFIHGSKDVNISPKYNRKNFELVPHSHKKFVLIEEANHYNVWQTQPNKVLDEILDLVQNLDSYPPSNYQSQ